MRGFHPPAKSPAGARGFQPVNARAKAQPFANGGLVRGPGTGTSDEVQDVVPKGTYIMPTDSTEAIGEQNLAAMGKGAPVDVNLSNGEFKLPPEQVHAIGVQALNQMKGATHTPVAARGFAPGAKQAHGGEPRMFFANGGVVEDENAQRFVKVPDTIGQQPGRQQAPAPAPAPAPTPAPAAQQTSRGFAVAGAPGVVRAGNSYEAAPAAASINQPEAMATQPRGLPTAPEPMPASTAGAGRGVVNPPMALPSKPLPQPEPASAPSSTEVLPGVYRNGSSYGDSAGAALAGAQPRGLPTAQNMAAADALAQRSQQESMNRVRGFSPGGTGEGGAPGAGRPAYSPASSGNFEWMNDLRDPRTLALRNAGVASTVHRNPGEAIMANKAANARVAAVQAAIGTQMHDAQQADTERYQSDNSLASNIGTEQMRQQGETQRSRFQQALADIRERRTDQHQASQEEIARQRLALDTTRLGRDGVPSGYRYKPDGTLEAIPGGPADQRNSKEATQQGKDASDVISILNQARPLLNNATGSYAGAAVDKAAQVFGHSTPGAEAGAQLKALQGALVSKMPKMSGPQSDKDVLLYREMAGQIGDPTIPVKQRLAAMKTVEELHRKYVPQPDVAGQPQQQPQAQQPQQRTVSRTGTINGRRVVQYSDGSVDYAD